MLDRAARAPLRTLSKPNAEAVAGHLVMAGRLMDEDPEEAYLHARAAVRRAGRVDVVREALALTAYATGRYAEALREVRTVRRLSGVDAHPVIEADSERGLGRPERALTVIAEAKKRRLPVAEAVELTLVESGARADLGEHDAALLVLDKLLPDVTEGEPRRRLLLVRADRLETLGRHEEAAAAREEAGGLEPDSVLVVDLVGDDEPHDEATDDSAAGAPGEADEPIAEATDAEEESPAEAAAATEDESAPAPESADATSEVADEAMPEASEVHDAADEATLEASEVQDAADEVTPEASEVQDAADEVTPEVSEVHDAADEATPEASEVHDAADEATPEVSEVQDASDEATPEAPEAGDAPDQTEAEASEIADEPASEGPEGADEAGEPASEGPDAAAGVATDVPATAAADVAGETAAGEPDESAPATPEEPEDSTPEPAQTPAEPSAPEQVQLDLFADTDPEEQQ